MQKKYFTIQQAQKAVDEIKIEIKKILELKTSLDILNSIDVEYTEEYEGNYDELNFTKLNKEFHKLSFDFFSRMEEIEKKGCVIKDIDEGLIDFYSLFNGKEIFLCWKYGEEKIEHWHDLECGYSGRQHVTDLLKKNKFTNVY